MVNSLLAPSAIIGLMGQRRNQNSLLPFFAPQQADELDELMAQRAPNGYVETPQGTYYPADQVARPQQQPMQAPQRERVSGWRVLDRVLGGQTITGGLDAERARLQAQAELPQRNARIQQVLGSITDPREQALFLGLGGEDWQKNVGQQYAPQVIGAGGIQSVIGSNRMVGAPSVGEFGDRVRVTNPITGQTTYSDSRPPSYQEATARINATNPVSVAQDATLVDPYSGRTIAQGVQRPDIQNVAPGGEALAFDASGNIINRVGSTQQRPQPAAEIKRADDLELSLANDQNSVDRVSSALALITDPDGSGPQGRQIRIGPWENFGAGVMNRTGRSNANSLGIAQIKTTVESLRQGILNDATGPQTEGDALRALNSILAGIDDPRVIEQGFKDYLAAKERTMAVKQGQIGRIRGGANASAGAFSVPPPPPGFELDR